MSTESVKGILVIAAVAATRRLRDQGRTTREAMQARLSAPALELLERKIEVARWYPVQAFCEVVDLCWDVQSGRDPAFLEREGAAAAERLFEGGRYQQLEYAERNRRADSRSRLIRQARLITTITGTFYDFLDVEVVLDDDRLTMVYRNAAAFGDPLIHTTIGFKNQINARQGAKRRWTGTRVRPDEVHFELALPERLQAS